MKFRMEPPGWEGQVTSCRDSTSQGTKATSMGYYLRMCMERTSRGSLRSAWTAETKRESTIQSYAFIESRKTGILRVIRNSFSGLTPARNSLSIQLRTCWRESKNKNEWSTNLPKNNISTRNVIPRKIPKSLNEVPPIDRLPVVGYQGHRPVYRPPQKQGNFVYKFSLSPPRASGNKTAREIDFRTYGTDGKRRRKNVRKAEKIRAGGGVHRVPKGSKGLKPVCARVPGLGSELDQALMLMFDWNVKF